MYSANLKVDIVFIKQYVHNAFPALLWWHWVVMIVVPMGIVFGAVYRKKVTQYRGIATGLSLFYGLFLLDALVVSRLGRPVSFDPALNLVAEYQRLVNGNHAFWIYMFFNVVSFSPLGLLLFEALSVMRNKRGWIITVLLVSGLSLLIESLQWILGVGFFEVTDLLLNTLGGAIGATVAFGVRSFFCKQ